MPLPEQLGRFRRIRRLGSGAFATVWLYHDEELDSEVAVKALADNMAAKDDIRERFLAESRLLRRADSEHLVRVYDVGEVDGTPYFVMSYADRGSLADVMASGRLPSYAELADLVEQAAKGLSVLHALDIVHRDIKPENLLLRSTPHGGQRLMVADLGVAKNVTGAAAGTWIGTPSWMAPEQRDTQTPPDSRADVHGLGAVAYALLTGRPPQPRHHAGQSIPLPSEIRPVPLEIEQVVMRALEYDREDRWPGVAAFSEALSDAARTAEAGGLRPSGIVADSLTKRRGRGTVVAGTASDPEPGRSRRAIAGIGLIALLAALIGGGYLVLRSPDDPGKTDERTASSSRSPSASPTAEANDATRPSQSPTRTKSPTRPPSLTPSATPSTGPSTTPPPEPDPPPSEPAEAPRTKYWVDTFSDADVYAEPSRAGAATGRLYGGTVYVYCKAAGERVEVDGQYNHWWLLTDPDEGPAEQWVPAYYLKNWGNDEARTNSGDVIPDC
ncbi:serine/threonine-protein kinase [Nocardioides speluncae]|uniref:serine/threonine-protein kinase n=1 Tax=Nocardioides speluncae TaxID=2670337 RepID=UPI001379BADD|nr:serine/threonine-protein kinase [Nocardioides speluncae]